MAIVVTAYERVRLHHHCCPEDCGFDGAGDDHKLIPNGEVEFTVAKLEPTLLTPPDPSICQPPCPSPIPNIELLLLLDASIPQSNLLVLLLHGTLWFTPGRF